MMILLDVAHVAKSFGTDKVLKDVSLRVQNGERIGLVGVNGSGKTTLLRILSGELKADEGIISLARGIKLGYMTQMFRPRPGVSVLEEAQSALEDLLGLEERLRTLELRMGESDHQAELPAMLEEYARLTERYERGGGYEVNSRVQGVLGGLGFNLEQQAQEAATLSGGELTRLGLAKLLLQKPDLLLLDEPTNHLDMAMLSWLENYLREYTGAVILVSHDRYFLNAVCTGICELLFGETEQYAGNYNVYMKQRDERFAARNKAYQLQQKESMRQRAIIERFRSFNREKSVRAAESREKALERMELLDRPEEEKQVAFRFEARRLLGDIALEAQNLSKSFGDRVIFEDLSLLIRGGDRVAIIGPNGVGKTTLLRCLIGLEPVDRGKVSFAARAQIGYYDQRQQDLHDQKDVLNEVWDEFPLLNQSQIRGALSLFLFRGDDVFTPVGLLSGGERARVNLAKLMLRRDNFLVLDEPTNHLDADGREAFEQALEDYEGTILAVSHDRYFINRFADRILVLDDKSLTAYEGNYDDYQAALQRMMSPEDVESGPVKTRTELAKERRADRLLEEERKSLMLAVQQAELAVHQAEAELKEAVNRQADPEIYTNPDKAAAQAVLCKRLEEKLERLFARWDRAEQALNKACQQPENP